LAILKGNADALPCSCSCFPAPRPLRRHRISPHGKGGRPNFFSGDRMSLTLTDVKRIAHLARLELADDAAERTQTQLNHFFSLVEQMQAVDTNGIEPLAHPIEQIEAVALRLRDDAVTERVNREEFQRSAPAVQEGLFLVPKVIE
jgi:aspartyl-tRNA(Asn)/glutamyl-tRNA(Gln) amidotransferase subunit C